MEAINTGFRSMDDVPVVRGGGRFANLLEPDRDRRRQMAATVELLSSACVPAGAP
jgi:hypothetical protein